MVATNSFFTGTLLLLLSLPLQGITVGYKWLRMVRVDKCEYWWLPLGKGGYEWLRGLRGGHWHQELLIYLTH